MGMKVVKCYFSYSFHPTWLKLYGNIGLGGPPIGCAQSKDSSNFGFLVNLLSNFWPNLTWDPMEMKVVKCYFSYSFHPTWLKLYGNISLGGPIIGCAQFADSAKFGILVNLLSIFRTKFGCFFATCPLVFIGFSWNFIRTMAFITRSPTIPGYWLVLFLLIRQFLYFIRIN